MADYISDFGPVVTDPVSGATEWRTVFRPATKDEQAKIDAHRAVGVVENHNQSIKDQIEVLEAEVTPRRYREAFLSGDNTFIADIEYRVTLLRSQLR